MQSNQIAVAVNRAFRLQDAAFAGHVKCVFHARKLLPPAYGGKRRVGDDLLNKPSPALVSIELLHQIIPFPFGIRG
ncbi:MAG: hypothetical protein JW847_05665 [Candidatus Omnitrophica bacterium]|nr:hypothetical protein [Candidatus Omnitrophota bacterium]